MFALPYIKTLNATPSGQTKDEYEEENSQAYSPSPSSSSLQPASPHGNSRYKRQSEDDIDEKYHEFSRRRFDPLPDFKKMFLLSLLPDLDQMSLRQMRLFKRRVIDLIEEILQDTQESSDQRCSETADQLEIGEEQRTRNLTARHVDNRDTHSRIDHRNSAESIDHQHTAAEEQTNNTPHEYADSKEWFHHVTE